MMYLKKIVMALLVALLLPLLSCNADTQKDNLSFCYWKTSFRFSPTEHTTWTETGANHLYIRYFDVDWNEDAQMAMPIETIWVTDTLPCAYFTPCVFLTNRVFEKSSTQQLDTLSLRIKKRILNSSQSFAQWLYYARQKEYYSRDSDELKHLLAQFEGRYSDILIDCDWTEKTKDKFFYFLKQLKKDFSDKEITATLRLWQYKQQEKAGIPPVKRCLLMCYNMQTANNYKVENSIASLSELQKYVSGKQYPLKLDLALPIFHWAVLFRNERFVGLLGEVAKADLDNNIIEYQSIGNNRYRLIVDKVIGNFFARNGDEVRVEMITDKDLEQMIDYLKKNINFDKQSRITLFSWNELYIKNYGTNEIKNIFTAFSK
ncbi:MAG: hypothetical protein LBV31_00195 [Prevotellaceae bacterium]|jgi:hypothetical protein|nr:hypothetical protein [Prevotellaceae bacterium]